MNTPVTSLTKKLELIRTGKLAPADNIKSCLTLIDALNPKINALVYINRENNLGTLQKLNASGQLYGAVFSAKDHFFVNGMPASEGSKQTVVVKTDSTDPIIASLISEGAICIGKGNQPEYGKSNFTENDLYGRSNNPANIEYTCGGSTGGDAAAVAAGLVDFAIGGDSGGSLRVPANFCGIFGMLPSKGTVNSSNGHFINNSFLRSMGSIGPLTRTLEDLECAYRVLTKNSVVHIKDQKTLPNKTGNFAYIRSIYGLTCDPEIEKTLNNTIKKFEAAGYKAHELSSPLIDNTIPIFYILAGQAGLIQEDIIRKKIGLERDLKNETETVRNLRAQIATLLPPLTVESLLETIYNWETIRAQADALFTNFDFILSPVAATKAVKHNTKTVKIKDRDHPIHEIFHFARFANVLGLPAISFPTEIGTDNIPLGLQVATRRFYDHFLFDLLKNAGY